MVEIDIGDYDAIKLAAWTVADVSAILWGLSAADVFSVTDFLGSSSEVVLMFVGLVGAYSFVTTWTNLGDDPR